MIRTQPRGMLALGKTEEAKYLLDQCFSDYGPGNPAGVPKRETWERSGRWAGGGGGVKRIEESNADSPQILLCIFN